MDRKKLVACTVFENEAAYLPEWIAYHHLAGVQHFVLYDNSSTDDPRLAVRNSPLTEHMTLIRWPQRPGRLAAYRHFIDIFAPGFEWVAFLDMDEFLLPLNSRNAADTLDWLKNAAAVLVHRRVFGPGTWEEPPPGLVIENYDRRAADDFPANRHVKAIVRCNELLDVGQNPNEFRINGPVFNTAGHLAPNSAIQAQPCYQNLVINHYYTRSRQDWLAKLQRNSATPDDSTPSDEPGLFDHLSEVCQIRDTTIQAFAPAVRQLLGYGSAASPLPPAISPRPAMPEPVAPEPGVPAEPVVSARPELVAPELVAPEPVAPEPVAPASVVSAPPQPAVPEPETPEPETPEPETPESETPESETLEPETPEQVVAALTAAVIQRVTESLVASPGQSSQPAALPPVFTQAATSLPAKAALGWVPCGQDALERVGGLGLVFRDRSRAGEPWLAALRGVAADAIDPAFLLDEFDRIRDFPSEAAARAACDAALIRPGH
jgi:Glycosyltransferase family 92